jgi:hypothetical protein
MKVPPDVIVMELLPEPAEAWAFIERRCGEVPIVPLIILTSLIRPDRAHRRKARALGCAAFVAKPCSLRQLVDIVIGAQTSSAERETVARVGLSDATDDKGLALGVDGLLELARGLSLESPMAAGATLLGLVDAFRHGAPASDDETLIVLRRSAQ